MKTIQVTYKVVVPDIPDILFVEGTKETVPIEAVTEDSLRAIGQEWTNELIEKARKKSHQSTKISKPAQKKKKRPDKKAAKSDRKKSKYKGVSPLGKKWRAQFYDSETKKIIHLGTFDSELLAAAAYQEHIGNKKEAKRLRNEYEEGGSLSVPKVNTGMQPGGFLG